MKRGSGAAALRNFQVAPASCRSAAWAVSQRAPSSLRRACQRAAQAALRAASAAAWLALVFLLPVAGTLLYVLAGYRRAVPAAESCDCRGDAVEQIVARGCGTRPAPRTGPPGCPGGRRF